MSREEILADFQACTGIEDFGIALHHLEEANWVLMDAVNRAIPQDGGGGVDPVAEGGGEAPQIVGPLLPQRGSPPPEMEGVGGGGAPSMPQLLPSSPPRLHTAIQESISAAMGPGGLPGSFSSNLAGPAGIMGASSGMMGGAGVSISSDFLPMGSSTRSRMLELNVEYRDRMVRLKVPDHESIQTVKTLLQAEVGVPPCQQELRGWKGAAPFPVTDRRLLSEMNLPKENFLYLLTPELPTVAPGTEDDPGSSAETNYKLTIIDEHEGGKMYNLTFPGRHTVNQVKRDVATVTGIPVFRQEWTGWPEDTNDELSLLQISLPIVHTLTVTQVPLAAISRTVNFRTEDGQGTSGLDVEPLNISDEVEDYSFQVVRHDGPSGSSQRPIVLDDTANSDVEISDDDYQDAPEPMDDDDFLLAQPSRSGIQPLLPDDFGDEALAGIKFGEEFGNRYGHPHPQFFPGSLEDALGEACNKPTSERRMLAVYLHHDSSVLTNVFCTQVFCAEAVLGLLSQNFVTWGWDLTYSSNKQRLLDMISRHFGSVASATIRNFSIEKLPLVILVAKLKGNMEIIQVIHGNVILDEFMSALLSAGETYQSQLSVEKAEEQERTERNWVKDEQEKAFQEAQLRDQEREVALKEAEEESRLQEQVEEAKRRSEQEAREAEEREKARQVREAELTLPPEPAADSGAPLANIRFRTPSETFARRFLASDPLSILLLFLRSKGYRPEEYKVLSTFPRRDLSSLPDTSSLEVLKLCPQETLTLEAISSGDSDSE